MNVADEFFIRFSFILLFVAHNNLRMENVKLTDYLNYRKSDKTAVCVALVYLILCVLSSTHWFIVAVWRNAVLSLSFCALVPIIVFAEYALKIRCGNAFFIMVCSLAFGAILGSCYNFYSLISFYDLALHGLAGVVFYCLGLSIAKVVFKAEKYFALAVFALCFSLAVAVIWEIFEYSCTLAFNVDMMEDGIVRNISSYYLAGNHLQPVKLEGITRTVIYYGTNGQYVIDGYLDLGLNDTMGDLIICFLCSVIVLVIHTLTGKTNGKFYQSCVPSPWAVNNL